MATTIDDLVIQNLHEAHATEKALVTTLQAHITMTPEGPYQQLLERHLGETRRHASAIERRLDALGAGTSLVSAAYGLVQTVIGQVLALSKGPVDMVRGGGVDEKLLKNAKDECATEALEIATYDALEALAEASGDAETARLAAEHRSDEERMLGDLRRLIPSLARRALHERTGGAPDGDDASRAVAADVRSLRDRAQRARPATALAIEGYDALNAGQVVTRLSELTQAELRAVAAYERRNRKRRSVLERIDALEMEEPWPGYDEAGADAVIERLRGAEAPLLSRVRHYEGRHRRRVAVLEAAQRELSRS